MPNLNSNRDAIISTTVSHENVNVALRLAIAAAHRPDSAAVLMPQGRGPDGRRLYASITFRELDRDSDVLARGLREMGVVPGTRLALLVKPSIDFVSLVFALFKAGAVTILIDPGMGRRNLLGCLSAARPEGFVAIPVVQAVRKLCGRRFAAARLNVTVGRRWFWDGPTIAELRARPWEVGELASTKASDPAAIIFTTGSTGPPKGVLYTHGNFDRQVDEIRNFYGIRSGEVDLACFPLFGLFNAAMGVTTVIPDMDASHPARVDPARIVEAVEDQQVTQSFGSPAIWDRVGAFCVEQGVQLPSLRRVLSAGAPVMPHVLESMLSVIHPDGQMHTPYGATEALPVASISGREVLGEPKQAWQRGAGICVGRRFRGIEWRVIRCVDGPIRSIDEAQDLENGSIGELIVRGPVVTREYATCVEWNELSKITDPSGFWHRMGDVGYFDKHDRFWFCGRAAHRVRTAAGPMYTIPCEAIFNQHPRIFRSALVGVGAPGQQRPVIICQPRQGQMPRTVFAKKSLSEELRRLAIAHDHTRSIEEFLYYAALPVDIRHNAKISREKLGVWAAKQLRVR